MKVLILSVYYNRPKLLRRAMESLLEANEFHSDWELVFGDDNSPIPGELIVREVLRGFEDRITCINSNMSLDEKLKNGLAVGRYANEIVLKSDADLVITLCDDDQLRPQYLKEISDYFNTHPDQMYAYSHLSIYNPLVGNPENLQVNCLYNTSTSPINPSGKLDSSQVAFRVQAFREGVRYPETTRMDNCDMPWVTNPDAYLFQQLFDKYGPCQFTGLIAQYKGIHDYQLVWHKKNNETGLKEYIKQVDKLGGDKF